MKVLKTGAMLALIIFALHAKAQRIKSIEGNPGILRSERAVNVEFTYDNMRVGKFDNGEEYVNSKRDEYNKKEPGRGDNWAKKAG